MTIDKLPEFAKDGQKNTDDLVLIDGFPVLKKPARQWFNWLFNTLTVKINEIIDNKLDASERGLALGVASLDDNKKVPVIELPAASTSSKGIVQLINDLTTGGSDKALTAEAAKNFVNLFDGSASKIVVPNKNGVPFIVTWFTATIGTFQSSNVGISATIALPVSMPNNVLFVIPYFGASTGSVWNSGYNIYLPNYSKTSISVGVTRNTNLSTNETVAVRFLVIGN